MVKWIRYIAVVLSCLLSLIWVSLQVEGVQNWARGYLSRTLSEITGYEVSVGRIHGLLPFYIALDDIQCHISSLDDQNLPLQKKLVSCEHLNAIPLWVDLPFGHMSVVWLGASGLDLTHIDNFPETSDAAASTPPLPIRLFAYRVSNIRLPHQMTHFLVTPQQEIDILFQAHGKLAWKPTKEELTFHVNITPYAQETSPGYLKLQLETTKKELKARLKVDLKKPASGSVFISTGIDRLSLECDLEGTPPQLTGNWRLYGVNKETQSPLSSFTRFTAAGTLSHDEPSSFSFTTSHIDYHELFPELSSSDLEQGYLAESDVPGFVQVDKQMKGQIAGRVQLAPQLSFNLACPMICINDIEAQDLQIRATTAKETSLWQGAIFAHGSVRKGKSANWIPLSCKTDWITDGSTELTLNNISLSAANYPLTGALELAFFPFSMQGRLTSSNSDISEISNCLGLQLFGNADMVVSFDAPKVTIECDGSDIHTGTFSCKRAHFDMELPQDGTLQAPFHLLFKGAGKNCHLASSLRGSIQSRDARLMVSVDTLLARLNSHEIALDAPLIVTLSSEKSSVEPFLFKTKEGGTLSGYIQTTPTMLQAGLEANTFPLEIVDPLLSELTLFGTISGHLEVNGTPSSPEIGGTFASSKLYFWNPKKVSHLPLVASGELDWQNARLNIKAELEGTTFKEPLRIKADLPIDPLEGPRATQNFSCDLTGELEVDDLFSLFIEESDYVGGLAKLDLHAQGILDKPQLTGEIRWNEGYLTIPVIGACLKDLKLDSHFENERFVIDQLLAVDEGVGTCKAKGWVSASFEDGIQYECAADFQDFDLIMLDDVKAKADASLSLSGSAEEAALTGRVDIKDAHVLLSMVPSDLPELDITYINEEQSLLPLSSKKFSVSSELDIHMGECGKVNGMGLQSLWKGDAHLTTKDKDIRLEGKFEATEATLEIAKKVFQVTKADIQFHGDFLTQSEIHCSATNDSGRIATQILLRGSLDAPRIDFYSTPPLSQKEILSWILFNKNSSEISPFEGLQLAQTLLKLKGGGGDSVDFLEKIKNTLHIDRLDIGKSHERTSVQSQDPNSLSNEVSVSVGKYISDGVLVTLSKDVTSEANRIGVEAHLTESILAEASLGDDAEAELSLEWKVNY